MNPSSTIRSIIYVVGVFLNAFIASLIGANVHLPVWVVASLAGYNAVMALMARANVTK